MVCKCPEIKITDKHNRFSLKINTSGILANIFFNKLLFSCGVLNSLADTVLTVVAGNQRNRLALVDLSSSSKKGLIIRRVVMFWVSTLY